MLSAVAARGAPFLRDQQREPDAHPIFRAEALRAYQGADDRGGRWITPGPDHGGRIFALFLVVAACAVALGFVVPMGESVAGPAVVRVGARTDITAGVAGTVVQLPVPPHARVQAGDALAHFYGDGESAELALLTEAVEQRLRQRMTRPGDPATAAPLTTARTALERARAQLELLTLRAPLDGTVRDVRIRPGEHAAAGDVLMTLITNDNVRTVQALLPGAMRPKLVVGQPVRLSVHGYPYAYQALRLTAVDDSVVGSGDGRQALGTVLSDRVPVDGAVVLVEATMTTPDFTSGGRRYQYHDGMAGTVEVGVGRAPLWLHLFPALNAVWPG